MVMEFNALYMSSMLFSFTMTEYGFVSTLVHDNDVLLISDTCQVDQRSEVKICHPIGIIKTIYYIY